MANLAAGFFRTAKGYTHKQYLALRLGWHLEQLAIFAAGVGITLLIQRLGWLEPANLRPLAKLIGARYTSGWHQTGWLIFPAVGGLVAYLTLGPKQKRPFYLKIAGVMYRYGTVNVDRNAGCRGGRITGATGTGKTQIIINPRNHSLAINECGVEKPTWRGSKAQKELDALRSTFRAQTKGLNREIEKTTTEQDEVLAKLAPIEDAIVGELYAGIRLYQQRNPKATFTSLIFGEDPDEAPPETRIRLRSGNTVTPDDVVKLLEWARSANAFGRLKKLPFAATGSLNKKLTEYSALIAHLNTLDARINALFYLIQVKRNDLQTFANATKALRYLSAPFGALVIGAKGNEWQTVCPMLAHYDRDEDICLLQTRPNEAPEGWTPPATFNLLSYDNIPATTYGQLLFNTYASISNKSDMDYFDNAARDMIGYGIELMRSIRDAQLARNPPVPDEQLVNPNLNLLCDLLSAKSTYDACLRDVGAAERRTKRPQIRAVPDSTGKMVEKRVYEDVILPPTLMSPRIQRVVSQINSGYWGLAEDTQKSVMGSVRNVLVPFTESEIVEVFCEHNTVDLREMEGGKMVCVAMPPKYLVQRQFVATILKNLTFTLVNERFALEERDRRWINRNLIIVDSDEHQKSAGKEDACVDIIRQAQGTLYGATQMIDSLYKAYGSKEVAQPIIDNLRNAWACQAASEQCSKATSELIGSIHAKEISYNSEGGSNTSFKERPIVSPSQLRALSPFYVYWMPAEGRWLYQKLIVMPVTPDGKTPFWWFGDWNPLHWLAALLGLPGKFLGISIYPGPGRVLFPWKAKAPLRAQIHYLLGRDGTFILLEKMSRKEAERRAKAK